MMYMYIVHIYCTAFYFSSPSYTYTCSKKKLNGDICRILKSFQKYKLICHVFGAPKFWIHTLYMLVKYRDFSTLKGYIEQWKLLLSGCIYDRLSNKTNTNFLTQKICYSSLIRCTMLYRFRHHFPLYFWPGRPTFATLNEPY